MYVELGYKYITSITHIGICCILHQENKALAVLQEETLIAGPWSTPLLSNR